MSKLSYLQTILNDVVTLGSFSPKTFHIVLAGNGVTRLDLLPPDIKLTFNHEFGHLLHYCSSYIGLLDLSYWTKVIDVITNPRQYSSEEECVTNQWQTVLDLTRSNKTLSIDDDYYFESKLELYSAARTNHLSWSYAETTGALFHIDGTLSERRFWGLRFFIGPPSPKKTNSFIRIPIGMRTILEHMAKSIDFLGEYYPSKKKVEVLQQYIDQAYEPKLLHYYSLTQYLGPKLKDKFGQGAQFYSFIVSGQLVALLSEIPFDKVEIWSAFKKYAEKHLNHLPSHMEHPHPSFMMPIIVTAAMNTSITLEQYKDVSRIEETANKILSEIQLAPLKKLFTYSHNLKNEIIAQLKTFNLGSKVADLIEEVNDYASQLSWTKRIIAPTTNLGNTPFTPVFFDDNTFIDGDIIDLNCLEKLAFCVQREAEMLRWHYTRNIITK